MLSIGAVIPYFTIPSLFNLIHPFGVLVAIGILLGARMVRTRTRQLGLDDSDAASIATWVVVTGFVISHIFDVITYQPRQLLDDPLLLVKFWSGISSFGGFLGAFIGMIWWCHRYKKPVLPFADALLFGLAPGWVFGRLGCFVAHDHPGRLAESFLFVAVKYPDGVRYDLGLIEALYAIALTLTLLVLSRRPRRIGTYVAIGAITYAPFRFALDFLRLPASVHGGDERYLGLTPAQYGVVLIFIAGIYLARRAWNAPYTVEKAPEVLAVVPPAAGGGRKKRRR